MSQVPIFLEHLFSSFGTGVSQLENKLPEMPSAWTAILSPVVLSGLGVIFFLLILDALSFKLQNPSALPILNCRRWYEPGYTHAKARFHTDGPRLIKSGFKKVSPYRRTWSRVRNQRTLFSLTSQRATMLSICSWTTGIAWFSLRNTPI